MKIAIYAKSAGEIIKRLTLEYCQKWNCYPAIEYYQDREALLNAIKSKEVDIILLANEEEHNVEVIREVDKSEGEIEIIRIIKDPVLQGSSGSLIHKKEKEIVLANQIETGLSRCGVPSSNVSLCRVHLKPHKKEKY